MITNFKFVDRNTILELTLYVLCRLSCFLKGGLKMFCCVLSSVCHSFVYLMLHYIIIHIEIFLLYRNLSKIGLPLEISPPRLLTKAIAFLLKVYPPVYAAVHVVMLSKKHLRAVLWTNKWRQASFAVVALASTWHKRHCRITTCIYKAELGIRMRMMPRAAHCACR